MKSPITKKPRKAKAILSWLSPKGCIFSGIIILDTDVFSAKQIFAHSINILPLSF